LCGHLIAYSDECLFLSGHLSEVAIEAACPVAQAAHMQPELVLELSGTGYGEGMPLVLG